MHIVCTQHVLHIVCTQHVLHIVCTQHVLHIVCTQHVWYIYNAYTSTMYDQDRVRVLIIIHYVLYMYIHVPSTVFNV